MEYSKQVNKDHYDYDSYVDENRWNSYIHQLQLVRSVSKLVGKPKMRILEVGVGTKFVSNCLKILGHKIETADVDKDLKPNYVSSLPSLQLPNKYKYDCIVCCEVLEHINYSDVRRSLKRMSELSNYLIISVPHKSLYFSISIRIPLLKPFKKLITIPFPFVKHKFNGEHYWELGTSGYPAEEFKKNIKRSGLDILEEFRANEFPWHHFFVLRKKPSR